jgi:hypothetical protein
MSSSRRSRQVKKLDQEFDFTLVLAGVPKLDCKVEDALFNSGCNDATIGMKYGCLWVQFSRRSGSLKDAILSAIRDVRAADIGARVMSVDECNLVTQADIGRKIGKSRQHIHQLVNGQRGPGGFPPPVCQINDETPLWEWCAVSYWLWQNNMLRPEDVDDSEVIAAVNTTLDLERLSNRNPGLVDEVAKAIRSY